METGPGCAVVQATEVDGVDKAEAGDVWEAEMSLTVTGYQSEEKGGVQGKRQVFGGPGGSRAPYWAGPAGCASGDAAWGAGAGGLGYPRCHQEQTGGAMGGGVQGGGSPAQSPAAPILQGCVPASSLLTPGARRFCVVGRPEHRGLFSSILSLHPLDAIALPRGVTTENVSRQVSPGGDARC